MKLFVEVVKILADLYCPVSDQSLLEIGEILIRRELAKGELLVTEGQVCRCIYFIEKGMIRQFYYKNGRDLTEHFSSEGNVVICLESFLKQEPTRLMAEALEPAVVWEIPYEGLMRLVQTSPEIEVLYRKILEKSLIVSQIKADLFRFETAKERYRKLLKMQPEVIKRAPLIHIASYLLMTPETLSRVRATV